MGYAKMKRRHNKLKSTCIQTHIYGVGGWSIKWNEENKYWGYLLLMHLLLLHLTIDIRTIWLKINYIYTYLER